MAISKKKQIKELEELAAKFIIGYNKLNIKERRLLIQRDKWEQTLKVINIRRKRIEEIVEEINQKLASGV